MKNNNRKKTVDDICVKEEDILLKYNVEMNSKATSITRNEIEWIPTKKHLCGRKKKQQQQ